MGVGFGVPALLGVLVKLDRALPDEMDVMSTVKAAKLLKASLPLSFVEPSTPQLHGLRKVIWCSECALATSWMAAQKQVIETNDQVDEQDKGELVVVVR